MSVTKRSHGPHSTLGSSCINESTLIITEFEPERKEFVTLLKFRIWKTAIVTLLKFRFRYCDTFKVSDMENCYVPSNLQNEVYVM